MFYFASLQKLEREKFMKIISLLNLKGGVGKTTTSNNLAVGLGQQGYQVLLIDFDQQANTTSIFTTNRINKGIAHLLSHPQEVNQEIIKTEFQGVDLIPSNLDLSIAERSLLVGSGANHNKLQRVLRNVDKDYDYVIIDCPPVLNLLVTNALFVSHEVIIPIKVDRFALDGYQTTISQMNHIVEDFDLDIDTKVLFTMVNRNNTDKRVIEEFRSFDHLKVIQSQIRNQPKPVAEAGLNSGVVVTQKNNVGNDYRELVDEYLGNFANLQKQEGDNQ